MEIKLSKRNKVIGIMLIVLLTISGATFKWTYDRDYSKLYKGTDLIASHRFYVEMERTYTNIKYSYQRDNCIEIGGRLTETRCYYPEDYFTRLNRRLSGIKLTEEETIQQYFVRKSTPYYKYGTRGTIAGVIDETIIHDKEVERIEDFPKSYLVDFSPRDSTSYKLVWKIKDLNEVNWETGNYKRCEYIFGDIKIDLKNDCDNLDYTFVDADKKEVWIYFKAEKGIQRLDLSIVDPPLERSGNCNDNWEVTRNVYVSKCAATNTFAVCARLSGSKKTCYYKDKPSYLKEGVRDWLYRESIEKLER